MNTVPYFPYVTDKPRFTGVVRHSRKVYTFLGKFYVKAARCGYNALEGFREIIREGEDELILKAFRVS